ncbi:MAG: PAS domain S-box protein [Planctomycetes bacterium]|nr:PAS domain S-box protein [Planctomycetota bacterium]
MTEAAVTTVRVVDEDQGDLDDALITTSRDNLILSWNNGAETLTGYRAHEVIGKNIAFLFPSKHREVDALNARDAISGVAVQNSVVKALRRDGELVSLIYAVTPMLDREDRVVGLLRICKDISAFKTAQAELRRALRQLQRMDRVEDGVLKAMSAGAGSERAPGRQPLETAAPGSPSDREGFLRILCDECRVIAGLLQEINALLRAR